MAIALRAGGEIHADAIRVVPFGAPAVVEGKRVPLQCGMAPRFDHARPISIRIGKGMVKSGSAIDIQSSSRRARLNGRSRSVAVGLWAGTVTF